MEEHRFSISTVTQNKHRFYTCTIPSDVLAKCCFVTNREDDPVEGFQRVLDKKRAGEIAKFVDEGMGTIPTSIILSAQDDAQLKIIGKGKTVSFLEHQKAFLILDGQHRVYGFSLAEGYMRVPVVIYNGLSRADETRLFIDINSKQKGVSNELLLDIKRLAEYESDEEVLLRELFDMFDREPSSALYGRLSAAKKSQTKISRVTFKLAVSPILKYFSSRNHDDVYQMLNAYLTGVSEGLIKIDAGKGLGSSVVFRGVMQAFPIVAGKVKDRYGSDFSVDHFYEVLEPVFSSSTAHNKFSNPGTAYKNVTDHIDKSLRTALVF
ncbi:DGQHR domain-containing protein [Salinicola aestuarinus]|uniref:DGQHR domain-containing protein n=1 Tax=Salinicola aestuarinus TaxID=1949082 RepID=UPI001CB7276E|nr:DGQHR domain-containing protein [Salinicola aestuarinus]